MYEPYWTMTTQIWLDRMQWLIRVFWKGGLKRYFESKPCLKWVRIYFPAYLFFFCLLTSRRLLFREVDESGWDRDGFVLIKHDYWICWTEEITCSWCVCVCVCAGGGGGVMMNRWITLDLWTDRSSFIVVWVYLFIALLTYYIRLLYLETFNTVQTVQVLIKFAFCIICPGHSLSLYLVVNACKLSSLSKLHIKLSKGSNS